MDEAMPPFEFLSAVEQVRQRPSMFFWAGKPNAAELLEAVLRDVHGRTSSHRLVEEGRFHLVMVPNSHRAEVLLNAVCDGVFTDGPAGVYGRVLRREDLPAPLLAEAHNSVRFLAWVF